MTDILLVTLCILSIVILFVLMGIFHTSLDEKAKSRIDELVETLYTRVLADPELSPYFEGAYVPRVIEHQILMFRGLLLPEHTLPKYNIINIHKALNVKNSHFTLLLSYVNEIMYEYHVNEVEIQRILTLLETYRTEIVKVYD